MSLRLVRGLTISLAGVGTALLLADVRPAAQGQAIDVCINKVNGQARFVNGPADCRTSEDFRHYESGPGPAGPPGTAGQDAVTAYGTATLLLVPPSADFVPIPGLSVDVLIPDDSNRVLYISTDGGVRNTSAAAGTFVTARIQLAVDGQPLANAGTRLINAFNGPATTIANWSFAVSLPTGPGTLLGPGPHTIDLRANPFGSGPAGTPMEISGPPPPVFGSIRQGQLTVIAINK